MWAITPMKITLLFVKLILTLNNSSENENGFRDKLVDNIILQNQSLSIIQTNPLNENSIQKSGSLKTD